VERAAHRLRRRLPKELGGGLHAAREPSAVGTAVEMPREVRTADVVELPVDGE
jgi:hypothetical protein